MAETQLPVAIPPLEQQTVLNLIPVGLREASLDSPTFRATSLHFADQIDAVERWLDGYVKAASRLVAEVSSLEAAVNSFLGQSMPPASISEAVLDHDYTLLAMRRYGEGAREFWGSTLRGIKRYDGAVIDPIKGFLNQDLRNFKDARRSMEAAQKSFDGVISRYSAQSKGKEASSLREEAFQLHEARKLYLKASMDFCVQAPQLRASLDKLIVKIFADQWKEMRQARESTAATFSKWGGEMERVRGWSREMENSERAFKRELLTARKLIEEAAEQKKRPSRELEDYAASTVPYLGTGASSATSASNNNVDVAEKQGWLFIRTITGRPARTIWSRRWFFVKNGIFGWLVQGTRSGGVEESDRTGVLLCSVRPAFQEERRFCFEVKTKDQSIILQAETQHELTEWISAFEMAKRKALEDPASTETSSSSAPGIDPAFAISPPVAPEFAAKLGDGHAAQTSEDLNLGLLAPEREGTGLGIANRASFDVNPRRVMSLEREPEGGLREASRDHAARIIQKLDLHKRSTASPAISQGPAAGGGIASLISASHNILPVGPGPADGPKRNFTMPVNSVPTSSLAPSTLANPPAATNLSHTAVVVSGERGIGLGRADGSGVPSGILANLWGSNNWGHVNRLGDESSVRRPTSRPSSPSRAVSISQDDSIIRDGQNDAPNPLDPAPSDPVAALGHRKNLSIGGELYPATTKSAKDDMTVPIVTDDYPNYYPLPLKAQNAQFRTLFPAVPKSEKVVLVFRATWNPNDQQEFPGRVYVTSHEIYFFSNHLGLVLVTGISLAALDEVTAAPGRDCDYIYVHLKEGYRQDDARRLTIKVFLEPLKLLQRRLNFLVRNAHSEEPAGLEEIIKTLIKMESEPLRRRSSVESWEWEDVADEAGDTLEGDPVTPRRRDRNLKASLRIDGSMYGEVARTGREIQKFKLPTQPVVYAPQSMTASISRDFNVSAKALFHVMFGDKSAVFQLLYANRWATTIAQTPWSKEDRGHWSRKFKNSDELLIDTQTIDIFNDHLCYVVTNDKQPHRLPYADSFILTTKFVVTHMAKSRSKLATFQSLVWRKPPPMPYLKRLIERQAYNSLEADALDLTNVAMDQVAKLGSHSKTNKAVEIFGSVGQQTQTAQIDSSKMPSGALPVISPIETRPVSIAQLVRHDLFARTLSAFSVVFDLAVAIGKGAVSLCTAHTLLVIVLAISALYNSWHGYRDGLVWYHERSTARFMARIGVSPNVMMSKGVYLHDVEDFVAPTGINVTTSGFIPDDGLTKTCQSTFREHLTASESTTRPQMPGAQLYRSRASLAKYRHDLLVGLRVVNRIEKDIVVAEYEQWVRAEEQKCRRVESMLRRLSTEKAETTKSSSKKSLSEAELDAELGEDFAEYCNSCRLEVSALENGTRLM
ncbi:Putative pleckstrin domain, PH-like domain superfamily, AH/BAR domain superfamily, VASt [Septoria linicola]|uniref:Pleckstrin domain, PH-like domain superfamily, AH/BAR domain superfamily, VASt n=1 Tax=Septoria linicola TaxID=215465 RepID=A0A9Q9EDM5_9PEZI|nr:putative pleckstrin domain, PH-like domain superfamily, AH/BAR domain superfamily, VASt [Septoria linicola]USW46965.1 Putative pleckstrin domain, PH-like domain superfamily, AH/BAR domain superfamily, VASt [Septoria linicola]